MQEETTPLIAASTKPASGEKMPLVQAQQEINDWLDSKKVPMYKRDELEKEILALVKALQYGMLTLENRVFRHKLLFPLKSESEQVVLDELRYEPRLRGEAIDLALKGVKPDDTAGFIKAHIVALTGKSKGQIGLLDTEDRNIARAIAVFFM